MIEYTFVYCLDHPITAVENTLETITHGTDPLIKFFSNLPQHYTLSLSAMLSPRKSSNQLTGRREQGEFSKEEKKFLDASLPMYLGTFYSPSEDRPKKGDKKDWVLDNVYPKFLTKFNSAGPDGPNLDSLSTVSDHYTSSSIQLRI